MISEDNGGLNAMQMEDAPNINNGSDIAHEDMDVDGAEAVEKLNMVDPNVFAPVQKKQHLSPGTPPKQQVNTNGANLGSPISPKISPVGKPIGSSIDTMQDNQNDSMEMSPEFDEARQMGNIEFRIPHISKFKDQDFIKEKKLFSRTVRIRCLPWKILFMLRTANTQPDRGQKAIGFFVQCNGDSDSTTWNCHARAALRIVAQKKGCEDIVRTIEHNFFSKENDWGYSNFILFSELINPEKGLVHDDSILVQARVVADAPHGVDWDSKRHTGFVGLKNQGATCYMNSLLQALYFTNKLRKAVYLMPTESDDSSRSVPLALQRVFHELQTSQKSVGTKKLTRSFGWETLDSFMQHDAQELCRVLMDNVECKMKGTSVEDTIPSLFRGKTLSYVKCKHVCFESKREENFYDIQLKVKGNTGVYEAFKDYIDVETLDQDNKYDAGEHGLQEAEKGVLFVKFPPVLYLQLMRFQYDYMADANIKINDKFEFPYTLNLDPYLKEPSDAPATYFLHAVLVHSGDNHGGHYIAYINPKGDDKWFKFDDDVVSRCSHKEAIQSNYGGYEEDGGMRLCTNAYMLVYIAESAREDVLCPVEESDMPETLRVRFQDERHIDIMKRREKAEAHLYTSINFYLEEDFYGWQGFDLLNVDLAPVRRLRVPKTLTMEQLIQTLAETLHQPPEKIKPWVFQLRRNQTYRVCCLDLKDGSMKQDGPLNLWVQILPPDSALSALPPFDLSDDLLFFLKYFNPCTATVHYCGTVTIRMRSSLSSLADTMRARAGLPTDTKLLVFEERKPLHLEPIHDLDRVIEDCTEEVMDGNILVFQPDIVPDGVPLRTAADFFRDVYYRTEVLFVDKTVSCDEGFALTLSSKLTYWQVANEVAHYLNTDSTMLQFFKVQSGFNQREPPGNAIRCNYDGQLKDMLPHYPRPKSIRKLFYQRLTIPITDLENMRQLRCVYVNSKLKEEAELVINVSKTSLVKDVLDEARKQIELPSNGSGKLRLLEVTASRITHEYTEDFRVANLQLLNNKTLRVEEVPSDEVELRDEEAVIFVAHFHKESFATFGIPFTLKIRDGESFLAVRERIQRRLDVQEKEFEKWRFAVVATRASYLPDDSDTTVRINIFNPNTTAAVSRPWLGLEHKFPPKRPRYTLTEKPIKIHN